MYTSYMASYVAMVIAKVCIHHTWLAMLLWSYRNAIINNHHTPHATASYTVSKSSCTISQYLSYVAS